MREESNFQNSNEYCKIREIKPKNSNNEPLETDKVFLHLGSFLHRTSFAAWDLSNMANEVWAKFVTVDWPKTEFDEEKVLSQLLDYIKDNKGKEFIISGLSFWEIVARNLFDKLSEEEKKQIKLYISICWVSEKDELNLPKHIDLVKKVNKKILEILAWVVWKVDRWWLWQTAKSFASKNAVDRSPEVVKNIWNHKIERHVKAASVWINPWLIDRLFLMLDQKAGKAKKSDIESVILYSENDPTFTSPKQNALQLQEIHTNSKLVSLWDAWHAALVEKPEKYNTVLWGLIESKWWNIEIPKRDL